jgi:hypothetical protein
MSRKERVRCSPPVLAIGIGFARNLTDRFSIGQRQVRARHIWNMSATGIAIDIRTVYKFHPERIRPQRHRNFGTK